MNNIISKAYGLPETIDPGHTYTYKVGSYDLYQFWYRDSIGNYWEYTNAPEDHPDYDPLCGNAILVGDQPMPHIAPQYYTEEGYKRHAGVPDGVEVERNENYDPMSPSEVWFEAYTDKFGNIRFIYLDADVRESLDLWVQQQLRLVDAGLPAYRKYASKLFASENPKDRTIGCILILLDQGGYELEELIYASVQDCEFIDNTVKLLGRKFICDPALLDYLTEQPATRPPEAPLFVVETFQGDEVPGIRYMASLLHALRISPKFLIYWHANHQFSRIVHRLAMQGVSEEDVVELANNEVARVLATSENVDYLIDYKLRNVLLSNYDAVASSEPEGAPEEPTEEEPVEKSLNRVPTDDFGVAQVWSDLTTRRPDEQQFSTWLHNEPLHELTPQEEEELAVVQEEAAAQEENMNEEQTPEEGGNPEGEDV